MADRRRPKVELELVGGGGLQPRHPPTVRRDRHAPGRRARKSRAGEHPLGGQGRRGGRRRGGGGGCDHQGGPEQHGGKNGGAAARHASVCHDHEVAVQSPDKGTGCEPSLPGRASQSGRRRNAIPTTAARGLAGAYAAWATPTVRRRPRRTAPTAPTPRIIIVQAAGSGTPETEWVSGTMVPLPIVA